MIVGALDPIEGSLLIAPGAVLLAYARHMKKSKNYLLYTICAILIVTGVASLFYLSSLGGFGGNSRLSIWWGLTIIPYPAGWLIIITTLIVEAFQKKK